MSQFRPQWLLPLLVAILALGILATDDDVWRALYSGAIFGLAVGTMLAELTDALRDRAVSDYARSPACPGSTCCGCA